MHLGRTLVGAIIGAAIAIGIYLAIRVGMQIQAEWFPVITGLLVGLGVMKAHSTLAGHVSYARGAVAGLVAAGAMLGGDVVAKQVLTNQAKTITAADPAPKADNGDGEEEEPAEETEEVEEPVEEVTALGTGEGAGKGTIGAPNVPGQNEWFPFACMAVGIFLAYEFARGSAAKNVGQTTETPVPVDDDANGDANEEGEA